MIILTEKIKAENCEYEVVEHCNSATSLQGYVSTTYDKLSSLLGKVSWSSGDPYDKVNTQWSIYGTVYFIDEDGEKDYHRIEATVYNWKTGATPTEEYDWHIGGNSYEAVEFIEEILNGEVQPEYNENN